MRKLATVGALAFALSVVGSQAVFAATPAASATPATKVTTPATKVTTQATKVTTPASHQWKTTFTSGKAHDGARLTVSSTYGSGALHVNLVGLKKGDKVSVTLLARGKTAEKTIATRHRTVTAASGKLAFSFGLSRAQAREIEAALKAGDTLAVTFVDGPMTASGTFVKS